MALTGLSRVASLLLVHSIIPAFSAGCVLAFLRAFDAGPPSWAWITGLIAYPLPAALAVIAIGIASERSGAVPEPGGRPGTEG